MTNNDKKINLLVIMPILFTFILFISFTYALFNKKIDTNKIISLKSGTKYIGIYGENKNNIELNKEYSFSIENRGTVDTSYEIYLDDFDNNSIDLSVVSYTATKKLVFSDKLNTYKSPNRVITAGTLSTGEKENMTFTLNSSSTGIYKGKLRVVYKSYFKSKTYSYTGGSQVFTVPITGIYKIELWGAQGGNTVYSGFVGNGGKGGYTVGNLRVSTNTNLYVFVGGKGNNGTTDRSSVDVFGGYNNGGSNLSKDSLAPGGGGSTDIRLVNGACNLISSLVSRIMVAGAGGSSGLSNVGAPGGLNGGIYANLYGGNGSQTSGGSRGTGYTHDSGQTAGSFAVGGQGGLYGTGSGGAGYYGGGGGAHVTPTTSGGGGGGSSYISGYKGCVAIQSASSITPKSGCASGTTNVSCSYHYSGYIFSSANMIAGNASMPNITGTGNETGHSGNGYAKITFIE